MTTYYIRNINHFALLRKLILQPPSSVLSWWDWSEVEEESEELKYFDAAVAIKDKNREINLVGFILCFISS